jgi:uncharacterized membrane protein YphA (DoxX/SURF4 family)
MELPTDFLGYRPTVGELIVGLILAVSAVPLWHGISRAWDYLLDQIASQSNNFRRKRIIQLEKRIKRLQEYNEQKALLHLLRKIVSLLVLLGLFTPFVVAFFAVDTTQSLYQIKEALHVRQQPVVESYDFYTRTIDMMGNIVIAAIAFLIIQRSLKLVTEIGDFADPPETVKKLEARINALKAKGSPQKAA